MLCSLSAPVAKAMHMSLGLILVIILIILLLGGFSGRFGGYGYGMGHSGMGLGGLILVVLLVLLLLGKLDRSHIPEIAGLIPAGRHAPGNSSSAPSRVAFPSNEPILDPSLK
jgi:hypothetical protein